MYLLEGVGFRLQICIGYNVSKADENGFICIKSIVAILLYISSKVALTTLSFEPTTVHSSSLQCPFCIAISTAKGHVHKHAFSSLASTFFMNALKICEVWKPSSLETTQ